MNMKIVPALAAALLLVGCASQNHSARRAASDPSPPPNGRARAFDNRPPSAAPATPLPEALVPAPPLANREGKGLEVNPGPDQHVRTQDPTLIEGAPRPSTGNPAQSQSGSAASAEAGLAARVLDAISQAHAAKFNSNPARAPRAGEQKRPLPIEVTAKNGVVTLSGSVSSEADRAAFEQAASGVRGVQRVESQLTVNPSGT